MGFVGKVAVEEGICSLPSAMTRSHSLEVGDFMTYLKHNVEARFGEGRTLKIKKKVRAVSFLCKEHKPSRVNECSALSNTNLEQNHPLVSRLEGLAPAWLEKYVILRNCLRFLALAWLSSMLLSFLFQLLPQNGPSSHRGDGDPGGLPLAVILVPGLAIVAAAVWAFVRYRQRV